MIAAIVALAKSDLHPTWLGQSVRLCISHRCSSSVAPTNPISYLGAALAVILWITSGAALAQSDGFTYETHKQRVADEVREAIVQTSYGCARAIAFGDVNGGIRKRSQIYRDPRMLNCFNIILRSRKFPKNTQLPLFEKIVNIAIDNVIATGQP